MSISNAEDDFSSLEEEVAFYRVKVTNLEERLRLAESERDWYKEQLASCAQDKKRMEKKILTLQKYCKKLEDCIEDENGCRPSIDMILWDEEDEE